VFNENVEKLDPEKQIQFMIKSMPYILKYHNEVSNKTHQHMIHTVDNNIVEKRDTNIESYITKKGTIKRGEVYREFMENVMDEISDPITVDMQEQFSCEFCGSMMVLIPSEASIVCEVCGNSECYQDFSTSTASTSQHVDTTNLSQFAYKRINHFREWLTQIQAKESTEIPQEVIQKITKEIKKERIVDPDLITPAKVKLYLKKIGLSKYYEHIPIIITKICGITPPQISSDTEQRFIEMFKEIQNPFEKHCPENRKNFLSYSFTLHKFCQLIQRYDLLYLFPLLKSREKLYIQDTIWKCICQDCGWTFIPSL
jgi:transcription elongation factor Elf1